VPRPAPPAPTPAARLRSDLRPTDRIHLLFYAAVLFLTVVRSGAIPEPWKPLAWYGSALFATLGFARLLRGRTGAWAVVPRVLASFVLAPISYLMLSFVVPYVNPWHGERLLYDIDTALFLGHNPNVMLDRYTWPPLTELLQFIYATYYVIPLVLLTCFLLERKIGALDRGHFGIMLCLYGSYLGYFLIPATGPNINALGLFPPYFSDPQPGLWIAERLRASLLEAEWIKHDCWPSGHTALSFTAVVLAHRERSRAAFLLLLAPVILLIFSTMYLRQHYVIDVLCGLALAAVVLRYAPALRARWGADDGSPLRPPAA